MAWTQVGNLKGPAGETGPAGAQGPAGNDGAPGADGADGATGPQGPTGNSIRTGSGAPGAGLGNVGDVYIDTATGDLYTKS